MSFKLKDNKEVFGHHYTSKFGKPVILKDDLEEGIEAEANRDGTIFVDANLSDKKIEEAVEHEDVHLEQMAQGRLDYNDKEVVWKKDTKSPAQRISREGMDEGNPDFEWENEAYSQTSPAKQTTMKNSPLKQTRHDLWSQDPNLQNLSKKEKASFDKGFNEATKAAVGVGLAIAPIPFGKGKIAKWLGGALGKHKGNIKRIYKAFSNTPKQYYKLAGGKGFTNYKKAADAVNKERSVPVVGQPGKFAKTKDPDTKAISYVNPRISMTAAERKAAGY